MTKQLNIDEMLDVLEEIDHPSYSVLKGMVEAVADKCAEAISEALGVDCGRASFEGAAFAGTCVPFYAKKVGQPCPEPLRWFDETEWDDGEQQLNPETGAPL